MIESLVCALLTPALLIAYVIWEICLHIIFVPMYIFVTLMDWVMDRQ